MRAENLLTLKDDMVAFIEGHGMRRLPGYITEEMPSVLWEDDDHPDSWKDFVEMAKASGAPFVTMSMTTLDKEDLELLSEEVNHLEFPDVESNELSEVQWLEQYAGKLGFIQLGFIYQGVIFTHESSTEWFDRYQALSEHVNDFGDIVLDDIDEEEQ